MIFIFFLFKDLTDNSDFVTSDVKKLPTDYLMSATNDLMPAADATTVVLSSTQNISLNQINPTKFEDLNLTTGPSVMPNLPKMFLIGLCVLFFTIILILSCWCFIQRIKRIYSRRAENDVNADIYMDVADIGSMQALSLNPAYQGLNAPPRLPNRQKTSLLHHDYESNIATDGDGKFDLNLSQYMKKGEPHEYMDMNTVYETPDNENDYLDGYIIPTKDALLDDETALKVDPVRNDKSNKHEYIDMKTVYQTPSAGNDVDLDEYVLPCEDSSHPDPSANGEKTNNQG